MGEQLTIAYGFPAVNRRRYGALHVLTEFPLVIKTTARVYSNVFS